MANQPHPDKQAVTWRLHRDLLARVRATAVEQKETVLAFVARALEKELRIHSDGAPSGQLTEAEQFLREMATKQPWPAGRNHLATVLAEYDKRGAERDEALGLLRELVALYLSPWNPGEGPVEHAEKKQRELHQAFGRAADFVDRHIPALVERTST